MTGARRPNHCHLVTPVLTVCLVVLSGGPAGAQQRPLTTEDPEVVGAGRILVEGGVDWLDDQTFPASGLTGDLLRLPTFGLSFGLSSIAELQIDAGFHDRLAVETREEAPFSDVLDFDGDTTSDVADIVLATKVRLLSETEGRPGMGVRFATKLPTASNESGLGLDTTDVLLNILVAKTVRSTRLVGNVGLGILGDPTRGDAQNDVLLYGFSIARALTGRAELVGEVNGRVDTASHEPPPGTETRGTFRFGARYTTGPGRLDAAVLVGLTSTDATIGFSAGYTHVFDAYRVP